MIATGNQPKRQSIEAWLVRAVTRACNDEGLIPDANAVAQGVRDAISAAMSDGGEHRGGDRYFRIAYSELMARSERAADEAIGCLYRSI